jgi:hypothetical protein
MFKKPVTMTMTVQHFGNSDAILLTLTVCVVVQYIGERSSISVRVGILNSVMNISMCLSVCACVLEHSVLSTTLPAPHSACPSSHLLTAFLTHLWVQLCFS